MKCSLLLLILSICASFSLVAQLPVDDPIVLKKENHKNPIALIKTSMGDIYVELYAEVAPKTVENFIGLAEGTKEYTDASGNKVKKNFYDNLVFHRVIKDFMIQGGCPQGTGMGGPGYKFEDEINATALGLDKMKALEKEKGPHPFLQVRTMEDFQRRVILPMFRKMGIKSKEELQARMQEAQEKLQNLTLKECYENMGYQYSDTLKSIEPKKGCMAMANSGPNTNGSQFFINLADTPWLTAKHTVFGKVIHGMDIVEKIGETKVDGNSKPETPVQIHSIRLYKVNEAK